MGFMSMIALTAEVYGTKTYLLILASCFGLGVAAFIGPRLAAIIKVANQEIFSGFYGLRYYIVGIAFTIITILQISGKL